MGIGLDYGGIGGNFIVYPSKNVGVFAGFGIMSKTVGYNFGLKFRAISDKKPFKIFPFVTLMFGKNALIVVTNGGGLNKSFHGLTYGLGVDFAFKDIKQAYWSVGFLIPSRSDAYDDYKRELRASNGVTFEKSDSPALFTLGYRIILGSKIKK